jgi:hypothetical protein
VEFRLTVKQEKFVNGLIAGLSQREAYRQAYDAGNMKEGTIARRAFDLSINPRIRARYEQAMEQVKQEAVWTRQRSEKELLWMLEQAKEDLQDNGFRQANSTAFVNAIRELNEIAVVYPMREKQIEKMDHDMHTSISTEEKLAEYLGILTGEINDNR